MRAWIRPLEVSRTAPLVSPATPGIVLEGQEMGDLPTRALWFRTLVGGMCAFLWLIPRTGWGQSATAKWMVETGGGVVSSPVIGKDGTLYIGSNDGNLYAILPDGTVKWKFATGGAVHSRPALGTDGTVYIGSWDHNIYAISADGTAKWVFPTGGKVNSSPVIGPDGSIYVGSWDHNVYALDPDGSLKWTFTAKDAVFSSPALGPDGVVYAASWDHRVYAITPVSDAAAGTIRTPRQVRQPQDKEPAAPGQAADSQREPHARQAPGDGETTAILQVGPGRIRDKPSLDSRVKYLVPLGEKLWVLETRGSWHLIRLADGRSGWAHESLFSVNLELEGLRSGTLTEVREFRITVDPEGEEQVVVALDTLRPPRFFAIEGDRPRLVCDFVGARPGKSLTRSIDVNGRVIRKVRVGLHKEPLPTVRVVLDLVPGQKYEGRQVSSTAENTFALILHPAQGDPEE